MIHRMKTSKRYAPTPTTTPEPVAPALELPLLPDPAADGDGQDWTNRRASAQATRAAHARQTSGRRRFVDPTTCDREYSNAEKEFMHAMHAYKQSSGRMFPTWSEVLEVLQALGYEKPEACLQAARDAGLAAARRA